MYAKVQLEKGLKQLSHICFTQKVEKTTWTEREEAD